MNLPVRTFPAFCIARNAPSALLLLAAMALGACGQKEAMAPPVQAVYVTPVRNDAGETARVLTAVLRPRIETEVSFRTGGKIVMRGVELGQHVRVGQVMARMETTDYALAVGASADQLRAAEVDATQSASDAARFRRLSADGSVGSADLERQQARSDAAAARADQARRQLALASNRLGYTTLTAPFDGVVTALRFETGQVAAEGTPIIALARPGELEVVADIPEALAPHLKRYTATATSWDDAGTRLRLRLRELAPVATPQTRTFRARFSIEPEARASRRTLRMGSTVELRLARTNSTPSAELPITALLKADASATVWIADENGGALSQHPVTMVRQSTDTVRVAGLPDGALVVTVGAQKLDAGMKVMPVGRPLDVIAAIEVKP